MFFERGMNINMIKEKWNSLRDYAVKNSKIIFPILIVVAVAATVLIALNAGRKSQNSEVITEESITEDNIGDDKPLTAEQIPLVLNENKEIENLIIAYYNAKGEGDTEAMLSACDTISETDLLYYTELSKYIESYDEIELYTKEGPIEESVIAYVYLKMEIKDHCAVPGYEAHYICKNEEGKYYIKNQSNCSEEEKEFIMKLNEQVDVVEFNNRVNVEYDELMAENPELLEYLGILGEQVQVAVGEMLAEQNVEVNTTEGDTPQESEEVPEVNEESVPDNEVMYARATTTVNVRSSDSEKADKLGKLTGGTKVQVQEVRVNGWTKIVYDKKDGYVKSEYLAMEESADGYSSIGTIVANTNINVRASASETADRLGVLTGGESTDLIALEGDWCKIKYNGQVGYVKAEYVTQQ